MTDSTIRSVSSLCQIAFAAMALASFVLYAAGVLILHQDRTSQWGNEREGMAAAVSYLARRAPLGAVALNVEGYFLQRPADSTDSRRIRSACLRTILRKRLSRLPADRCRPEASGCSP